MISRKSLSVVLFFIQFSAAYPQHNAHAKPGESFASLARTSCFSHYVNWCYCNDTDPDKLYPCMIRILKDFVPSEPYF